MKNQIKKVLSFALALVMCMSTLALGVLALEECEHNWELLAKKDPTCDEPGSKVEKCSECGELRTVVLEKAHTVEWEEHDATCTEGGYKEGVCSVCGETVREETDGPLSDTLEHSHELVIYWADHEEGTNYYERLECPVCGDVIEVDGSEILGSGEHDFELIIVSTPDCENEGSAIYKCKGTHTDPEDPCEYVIEEVVIAKLGHDTTVVDAVAPDCRTRSNGTIAYRTCSRCDKIFAEELDANGEPVEIDSIVDPFVAENYNHHNPRPLPGYEATEPHCNEDGTGVAGTIAYSACACGQMFMQVDGAWVAIDEIVDEEKPYDADNMAHHNVGALVEADAPDCVDGDGVKAHYECQTCGQLFDAEGNPVEEADLVDAYESENFDHHSATLVDEVAPHCNFNADGTDGVKAHYECDCGARFLEVDGEYEVVENDEQLVIEYNETDYHTYVKDEARSFNETCSTNGQLVEVCSVCYDEKITTIDERAGHDYNEPVDSATCTEGGYKIQNCKYCSNVKVEETGALGHDWSDWTETTAPSCTIVGKETRSCSRCNEVETNDLEMLAHNFEEGVRKPLTSATCTTPNTYTLHCKVCDTSDGYIHEGEALGHTIAQVIVNKAANCETPGTIIQYCSVCNAADVRAEGKYYMVNVKTEAGLYEIFDSAEEAIAAVSVGGSLDKDLAHGADAWTEVSKVVTCDGKTTTTYVCECECTKVVVEESDVEDAVALHKAAMIAAGKTPTLKEVLIQDTCTTPGTSIFQCTVCNENYADTVTHVVEEDYTIAPDCTTESNGYHGTYCHTCSERTGENVWLGEYETLPFAHTEVELPAKAPTCTDYGYNAYVYCSVCEANGGVWNQDDRMDATDSWLPRLGHDWAEEFTVDVEPTCTEGGSKSKHCTRDDCDATTEVTAMDPLGHDWGEWVEVTPADCETTGTKIRYCQAGDCEEHDDGIIEALGHNEEGVIEAQDSWCEKVDGKIVAFAGWNAATYCTRCYDNATDKDAFIAAIKTVNKLEKHTINKTEVVGTYCDEDSYVIYDCEECGIHYIASYVYGVAHTWGEAVASNCLEAGYIECTVCGDLKTADDCESDEELEELEALERLAHKNAAGEVLENKCTNDVEDRVCVGCGKCIGDSHTLNYYVPVVQEQTCTKDGIEVRFCEYCGFYELTITGEATGHTATDYIGRAENPTLDEVGYDAYKCGTCDEICYVEVEKLQEIGVEINAESGINPNGAFVNGGLVTFTIDLTMPEVAIDAMKMSFYYNPTYISFESAEVNSTFAGDYALETAYNAVIEGDEETGEIVVIVNSILENARKDMEFEAGEVIEGFVTLTFRISSADYATYAILTAGAIETTGTESEYADFAASYTASERVDFVRLGNLNGDADITMADANSIVDLITVDTYQAEADLNMDGTVDMFDWALMRAIILKEIDYSDLFVNA